MRFFYNNKIEDTTLTASSNGGDYNIDDLKVAQLARLYGFADNDESVIIAFTEATNIKSFIVDIGNMTSTATITLEGNATNVWTAPSYSQELIITDSSAYLIMDETYQYYRLVMDDSSISAIEIGYLFLDSGYLQMPAISPQAELNYNNTSASTISLSGQVFGDNGYDFLDTTFNFPQIGEDANMINGVSVATRKEIIELWQTVKNNTPFWVFLYENNLDEIAPLLGIISGSALKFKKLGYGKYYSTQIRITEVK